MQTRIPPPILALGSASLMWWLDRSLALGQLLPRQWQAWGVLPAAIGLGVTLTAMWQFRQARTTINPMKPEAATELVTGGIFRFSRNPMYFGLALVLTGWAIWLGTPGPWLGLPLFVVAVTLLQIVPEERVLKRLFGPRYVDYCRNTGRWFTLGPREKGYRDVA